MHPPPQPPDEEKRQEALLALEILDTLPEARFDRLTRLARHIFGTPIALVSLVDAQRQWFKSRQGLDASETSRDISFCGHAILSDAIFHIPDASQDPRFSDNPLVTGPPDIRFYAGAPLRTAEGYRIGTLCIIDREARRLTQEQLETLRDLADCVEEEINLRQQQRQRDALMTLTRIAALPATDPQDQLREALALGCGFLGLPMGIVSRIDGETYEVQIQVSPPGTLSDGMRFPMGQTYCHLVMEADDVVAIEHMAQSRYAGHPCYQAHKMESYIGMPLRLDGAPYGTLSFSSPDPRSRRRFSEVETEFVRLLGNWAASALQRWRLDKALQGHQALDAAIARAQAQFIRRAESGHGTAFEGLLADLLALTDSEYGFVGEVLHTPAGEPYLKTHALSDIAWDEASRAMYAAAASQGMEFRNPATLFGTVLTSGETVIANDPGQDPRRGGLPAGHPPLRAFLGLPVLQEGEMVGMIGLANRPGGYDQELAAFLQPLLATLGQLIAAARARLRHRENERRLQAIIEGTRIGTWEWNVPSGETVFNERWAEIAGYTLAELEPISIRTWADLAHPEDMQRSNALLQQHFAGELEYYDIECRMRHKDGHWVWVHDRGRVVSWTAEGQPLLMSGTHADITAKKTAQFRLEQSQRELQNFFDLSLTFLCIANTDGYFEKVNTTFLNVLGYPEAELLQQPFINLIHPEDIGATQQEIIRLAQGEPTISFTNRYRCQDGSYIWLMWNCAPDPATGKLYATAIDITRQRQDAAALRDQTEHTQAILNTLLSAVITIDQYGVITSVNPATEHIFGYRAEDMLGQNIKRLMPEPYHSSHDGYLRRYRETGIKRIIGSGREVEGQRQDGTVFPLDLAVSEITRQGQPMYVGILRDITDRKRAERLKTEFVSTVSHELRTPLTSISGALGLIAGGALGELPPQAHQMVDIAYKNSQRLTHLINDLLDIEKIAAGQLHFDIQLLAPQPLLEQALESNRSYGAGRGVVLVLVGDVPSGCRILVDPQRLMQVMSNLLSNAIKFSPANGTVEVTVAALPDSRVRVTVSDRGPGIPPEFQPRVFEKFAQADASDTRQKGGTGLGLAITRELVERMGGQIGFTSQAGQGTCFYIDLPCGAAFSASGSGPEESGARILVVEDDPDVAHLLRIMLTRAGYAVDTAATGAQALEALQRETYAAVSLDLMLPDTHGLEIIRQIRQQPGTADLPIIVLSARMEEGRLAINSDAAQIEWLAKPIEEPILLAAIDRQLAAAGTKPVQVLHIEDDADLHEVVKAMVPANFALTLAKTLAAARAELERSPFDLVLLDLGLPDGSGWDLLPLIRQRQPGTPVVILTGADTTPAEARQVEAVLLKSRVSQEDLLAALGRRTQSRHSQEEKP